MTAPDSASAAPTRPAKKPLWRRLLKWTLRVIVVLVVLAIATYAITSYWAARTINAEIARIRAAGEPLTFADLDALTPKVDRAQDAGPYYTAAADLVNVDYETPTSIAPPDQTPEEANYDIFFGRNPLPGPVPSEALAWAQRGIDQNRLALDLVDRGSALSGCSANIQLQYGIAMALVHLGKQRALSNAISLRSRALAVEGHGDDAVQSVISSLGLLRTLDRQPILIDALVQAAVLTRSCKDAGIVLERGHPSDTALQKLDKAMLRLHVIPPREMFVADRVYYLEIMRSLIANDRLQDPTGAPTLPERESWIHLGIAGRVMVARSLPTYTRYIDACSADFPAILVATQHVADTPASIGDQIISPSVTRAVFLYAIGLATYRSTLIAIQIERYRLAHDGQLPDSLAQLPNAADLPKDPFTGSALLYVKTSDGYCVFSAGRGHPEDDTRHIDREKDPIAWSERWGIHIRTSLQSAATGK